MRTSSSVKAYLILLGAMALGTTQVWAEAGYSSANFLKIGTGARAAGMADSFTAVADDTTALSWNPAGLALLSGTGLSTTHGQWIQGVTNDHLALSHKLVDGGGIGLGFTLQNTQAFNAALEDSLGNYAGTGASVSASDWALSLAYGDNLGRYLQGGFFENTFAGLKATLLGQSAFSIDGTAVSFELGFLHQLPKERLLIGLDIQNIGTPLQDRSQPVLFKAGASWYNPKTFTEGDRLTFAADLDIHDDTGFRPSFGTEYKTPFSQDLKGALRLGVRTTDDLSGLSAFTFGAGLEKRFGNVDAGFDYAFVPYGAIGATHRFTLNLSIPEQAAASAAPVQGIPVPAAQPAPEPAPATVPAQESKPAAPSSSSLDRGLELMKQGQLAEALVLFQEAAKDPKDLKARQLLGNCLMKMGRLDEAQKALEGSKLPTR